MQELKTLPEKTTMICVGGEELAKVTRDMSSELAQRLMGIKKTENPRKIFGIHQ